MNKLAMPLRITIEDALDKSGFGKFNYFIIIFAGCVINNVYLESIGINFALPILECDLHLTYQQRGVLGAVGFIGIIASSHLWGFLADTTGRKRIMYPSFFVGFLITVVSSFSPNFETLVTMRFLSGFLISASSATIFAYLGEFHCQRYRNRAIFSAASISAFSAIFAPVIAWLFINQSWSFHVPLVNIVYKPWRLYILACGASGFGCGLMMCFLPESPKYLVSVNRQEQAIAVLKRIHERNTSKKGQKPDQDKYFNLTELIADEDSATKRIHMENNKNAIATLFVSMWHQTAPLFMRTHLRKTILPSLIQFIIAFTAQGVYMWFPYILNSSMQFTQRYSNSLCLCDILEFTQSTNFTLGQQQQEEEAEESEPVCVEHLEISTYEHTIIFEVMYVSLMLGVSYAIGKFGRQPILLIICLVSGFAGVLALIVKVPLLAIYLFLVLLCCGVGTTVVNAIVVDIFPTHLRAMAVCICLMVGRIGSVTGSNVLGALIDTHCAAALYSSAGSLIIAGCLSFLIPRPKDNNTKEQERI